MNKTDVVTQVSQKSGITTDICEKVIKAFEEQSSEALINMWAWRPLWRNHRMDEE